jgi:serine/threonine-protein phosphatase PGAM5
MNRSARRIRVGFGLLVGFAFATALAGPWGAGIASAGTRTLYLIRHGEYDHHDSLDEHVGKGLVPLGREQAELTGRRLKRMGVRFDTLFVSSMTRARETGAIIAKQLKYLEPRVDPDLSECTPPTRRDDVMKRLEAGEADSCRDRLDRVYERFFRPAEGDDVNEILVCHGNVIRYLWCRALDVDTGAWLNLAIANGGITVIDVQDDGTVRPLTYDDFAHIPPDKQTVLGRRPRGRRPRAHSH